MREYMNKFVSPLPWKECDDLSINAGWLYKLGACSKNSAAGEKKIYATSPSLSENTRSMLGWDRYQKSNFV